MNYRKLLTLAAVGLGLALPTALHADDDKEMSVAFNKLPPACQKTVHDYAKDFDLVEIESGIEHGVRVYEVEFYLNKQMVEMEMTEDGTLIKVERTIPFEEAPEAVKKAANWKPDSKRAIQINLITRYSYEVKVEGHRGKTIVDATGKPMGKADRKDDD